MAGDPFLNRPWVSDYNPRMWEMCKTNPLEGLNFNIISDVAYVEHVKALKKELKELEERKNCETCSRTVNIERYNYLKELLKDV